MILNAVESDGPQIRTITANTDAFSQEEKDCVGELWDEYLSQGAEVSGYFFLVNREDDRVLGYACYGPRALTDRTYDLYWIAVDPNARRGGVGRELLKQMEIEIQKLGGRLIVVETSGLEKYAPTRAFYQATGYSLEARLRDFYRDGDDLVIFTKHL